MQTSVVPILLMVAMAVAVAAGLLLVGNLLNPKRSGRVKRMPYESGMDPLHDTRRRFGIHFHLLAIAFLIFDVELLFLYPWAVYMRPAAEVSSPDQAAATDRGGEQPKSQAGTTRPLAGGADRGGPIDWTPRPAFLGGMVFIVLLTLGFVYDWRKGIFAWR